MTQSSIAMVAKKTSHLTSFMVMIYDELFLRAADDAFFHFFFERLQIRVAYRRPEFSSTNLIPISAPAFSAPAIKTRLGFIMRRKTLRIKGLFLSAARAYFD